MSIYLILSYLISFHLISSHLIHLSCHVISFHFISSYLIPSHLISSHLIHLSCHVMSSHLISLYLILSYLFSSRLTLLSCYPIERNPRRRSIAVVPYLAMCTRALFSAAWISACWSSVRNTLIPTLFLSEEGLLLPLPRALSML